MPRYDQGAADGELWIEKYKQLYDYPEFVKSAAVESLRRTNAAMNFYADARAPYQFPCDSPAATLVSYTFFLNKEAEINPKVRPLIEERFNGFGRQWNVSRQMDSLRNQHVKLAEKFAEPDSNYALVEVTGKEKRQYYPIRNKDEIKAAAEWFHRNKDLLRDVHDFATRRHIADKILTKVAATQASLPEEVEDTLHKFTLQGIQYPSKLAEQIDIRVKLANRLPTEVRSQMLELKDFVSGHPFRTLSGELGLKFAETLEQFDREYHLINKYDRTLLSPEDAVFGIPIKKAERIVESRCALLTGSVYDKSDFKKLSLHSLRDAFGDSFVDGVRDGLFVSPTKMAEIADTLPLPDARLLDALMEQAGAQPVEKTAEKAAYPQRNDFLALAMAVS